MPRRGDLRERLLGAAISFEMKGLDGGPFRGAGSGDEIGNNELMEIATGQSSCFQYLRAGDQDGLLQSVACGIGPH
jgi:hypothetical protein